MKTLIIILSLLLFNLGETTKSNDTDIKISSTIKYGGSASVKTKCLRSGQYRNCNCEEGEEEYIIVVIDCRYQSENDAKRQLLSDLKSEMCYHQNIRKMISAVEYDIDECED